MTSYPVEIDEGVGVRETLSPRQILHLAVQDKVTIPAGKEKFSPQYARTASLSSTIGIASSLSAKWQHGAFIQDVVRLRQTLSVSCSYHMLLHDYPRIHEALSLVLPASLHDHVGVHEVMRAAYGIVMLGGVRLASALSAQSKVHALLTDTVRLADALTRLVGASLHDGVGFHDGVVPMLRVRPVMSDHVGISETLGRRLLFACTLSDGVEISEVDIVKAIYHQTVIEGVRIAAAYISSNDDITAWAINMRNGAATEYRGFNFNSFTKMGDKYLAASSDGLYELDGDTDNGAQIISDIAGGFAQFGGSHLASLKAVYLGVRGGGDFVFRLVEGDGTMRDYVVTAQDMKTARIDMGKGLRARYFSWELISTGQDFDLDSIEFVPIILKRRI